MYIINNFEVIKGFLNFDEFGDVFYFVEILKRKKENPDTIKNNSNLIKPYYIHSLEYFKEKMPEIINLCKFHNARAYINLTSRSYEKIAFQSLKKITDIIMNKDYKSVRHAYTSSCGSFGYGEKYWVIDIDNKNFKDILTISDYINKIREDSVNNPNVVGYVETINGWHIITHPFNCKLIEPLQCTFKFEVLKNSPTLLYFNYTKLLN